MLSPIDWILKKAEHCQCLKAAQSIDFSEGGNAVIGQHQRLQIGQSHANPVSNAANSVVAQQEHAKSCHFGEVLQTNEIVVGQINAVKCILHREERADG